MTVSHHTGMFGPTSDDRIAALEAENARLRAALERVEWVEHDGWHLCAWCGSEDWEGHAPDCAWQAALAQTAQTSEVKA